MRTSIFFSLSLVASLFVVQTVADNVVYTLDLKGITDWTTATLIPERSRRERLFGRHSKLPQFTFKPDGTREIKEGGNSALGALNVRDPGDAHNKDIRIVKSDGMECKCSIVKEQYGGYLKMISCEGQSKEMKGMKTFLLKEAHVAYNRMFEFPIVVFKKDYSDAQVEFMLRAVARYAMTTARPHLLPFLETNAEFKAAAGVV